MSDAMVLLPDAERLVSSWAREQDEITDLVGERVYTILPKGKEFPLVRLVRISGADSITIPLVLDQPILQWDVWADRKALAYQVAATVRWALAHRLVGAHDLGVVQDVQMGGLTYLPDEEFAPAKPRYTFDTTLRTHALPATGS